jgi:hypothetical protein
LKKRTKKLLRLEAPGPSIVMPAMEAARPDIFRGKATTFNFTLT